MNGEPQSDFGGQPKTAGQPQKTGVIFKVESGQVVIYNGAGDKTWIVDTTAAPVPITLPAANSDAALGVVFTLKRTTGGANALTIATEGGNIDGTATYSLATQYAAVRIVSDGSNYWTLPPVPDLSSFVTSNSLSAATAQFVTSNSLSAALAAIVTASPGDFKMIAHTTIPSGWLECDGSNVSRTTYAGLFAVIGTAWGIGDNSTTFSLPDFRGRVPVGRGTGTISETQPAASFSTADQITVGINSQEAGTTKWQTGMKVQISTSGVLPTGISAGTNYFVRRISTMLIELYTTLAAAMNIGNNSSQTITSRVNITAIGSGNHTITHTFQARSLAGTFGHELNTALPAHRHETLGNATGTGLASSLTSGGTNNRNDGTATVGETEGVTNMPPSAVVTYVIKT